MTGRGFSTPLIALIIPIINNATSSRSINQRKGTNPDKNIKEMGVIKNKVINLAATNAIKSPNPCFTWYFTNGSFLASVKRGKKKIKYATTAIPIFFLSFIG